MKEVLTEQELALITVIRQRWIDYGLKPQVFDLERFTKGINWLYEFCKLPPNPIVHVVDSPMAIQRRYKELTGNDEFQNFSLYGNISDYGWIAFYEYFQEIGVSLGESEENFNKFKDFLLSHHYDMCIFDTCVIVSKKPIYIKVNERGQMHSVDGPAILFADGFGTDQDGRCFINGRHIENNLFNKFKKGDLTLQEFLAIENTDIRGAAFEIIGSKGMLKILDAEEMDSSSIVHKNGDVETAILYATKQIFEEFDNQKLKFVSYTCPSTNTNYIESVPPATKNALEAMAIMSPFEEISSNPKNYKMDFRN